MKSKKKGKKSKNIDAEKKVLNIICKLYIYIYIYIYNAYIFMHI